MSNILPFKRPPKRETNPWLDVAPPVVPRKERASLTPPYPLSNRGITPPTPREKVGLGWKAAIFLAILINVLLIIGGIS